MKFRLNYGYSINGKLRSGALIIDAKDRKDAIAQAKKTLDAEQDWYQINSCSEQKPKEIE